MWLTGPVTPRHVGSSRTRARTRVPCISRQTLNHCATREALEGGFLTTGPPGTTLPQCLSHKCPAAESCHFLKDKNNQPLLKIHLSLKYITHIREGMHYIQFGGFVGPENSTCFTRTPISSIFSFSSHCIALRG